MREFFLHHWSTILVSLITAGLMGLVRSLWKQVKEYKTLLEDKEKQILEEMVEKKVEPIYEELEELRKEIKNTKDTESEHLKLIISSFRFQLIGLCKAHIKRGFMSPEDYAFLNEYFNIYHDLGGNGQAKEFYEKAASLPIRDLKQNDSLK